MVRVLTAVLFPLLAMLAITAPVLVPWLLGADWAPTVVPTQILALGGASTLVIDSTGVVLMASGRSRAMLGFGVAHFAAYAVVVWFVAPFGIEWVAVVAAGVHTVFLFVSYAMMLQGSLRESPPHVWRDVAPALVSSLAMAAVAVPASLLLSAAHAPAFGQLVVVTIAAAPAYLVALRLVFPSTWRDLMTMITRSCRSTSSHVCAGARSSELAQWGEGGRHARQDDPARRPGWSSAQRPARHRFRPQRSARPPLSAAEGAARPRPAHRSHGVLLRAGLRRPVRRGQGHLPPRRSAQRRAFRHASCIAAPAFAARGLPTTRGSARARRPWSGPTTWS